MKRFLREFDLGFLVVLSISFIAVWPFISRASLPEGTDAELHIFRLAELSFLLRGGEFYPRWAPNFYHGYGYPIFNYYAPLTYYLGFPIDLLPWADAVDAVKSIFVLGMLLSGFGFYGFVRDNWGRPAGFVAAAVFLYAPYIQYIDPHARGVLPESFSFGMFAAALWALNRLRQTGGRWPWIASIILIGGVIMTHNLMGLLFYGILSAWVVWLLVFHYQEGRERSLVAKRLIPALVLGLGVAAIFWLPVILERNAVNLSTLIGKQDNYDFHTHFLSLQELFASTSRLDWAATEPNFRFNLGIAQWFLGGLGILLLIAGKVKERRHLAFFAFSLLFLLILMLPISTFLWESTPFLPYFQFPWRLLGASSAMLAILAGAGFAGFSQLFFENKRTIGGPGESTNWKKGPSWLIVIFVLFPIFLGLPLSQPTPWPDFGEVNQLRMTLIENTGRWLGTTSTADYVPTTVDIVPGRKGSVVAPFAEGLPPDRVNWDMLPEGATVEVETVRPLQTNYQVHTPRDTRLRLFQFYFPGWEARIDGEFVETELGRPEGFMVIPVPQGEHLIEVGFRSTPARSLATAISLVSLIVMILIAIRLPGNSRMRQADPFNDWLLLAALGGLLVIFLFILEPTGVLHQNSPLDVAEPAQVQVYADFGEQIALLGYDATEIESEMPDRLDVTLYWRAQEALEINYQVFVHVLGPEGLIAQSDKLNPGDFPTRRWPVDKYIRDEHELFLPEDLAPGRYEVAAGVWVQGDGWRLPLLDSTGRQGGDRFTLFTFDVE